MRLYRGNGLMVIIVATSKYEYLILIIWLAFQLSYLRLILTVGLLFNYNIRVVYHT